MEIFFELSFFAVLLIYADICDLVHDVEAIHALCST